MKNLTTHWRPKPIIRTKSLAVIWRNDAILVCAIPDDNGAVKGWRPLGGTVEFGEPSKQTVIRELDEEISASVASAELLGVVENLYLHHGEQGHEIVFLHAVTLNDAGLACADEFVVDDEGTRFTCAWVPVSAFRSGKTQLFPDGLLALL